MKKGILKNVFLCLMIAVILLFGKEIRGEFAANHTYYFSNMFNDGSYWWTFICALISTILPISYLIFKNKKFSLLSFVLFLFGGLLLFGILSLIVNHSLLTVGIVPYIVNEFILFAFGACFLVGSLAFGTRLSKLIFKFKENRIQEMFLNFGIGLGALMLIWQTLIGFGLFHPVVSWLIFLGFGFFIRYEFDSLKKYSNMIGDSINSLNTNRNWWKGLLLILLVFSLVYYFYGFQLFFISYSTACDANHAYMYTPKIIAENYGLLWGNMGTAESMPYLWYAFLSFWFSIGSIFSGNWLSPDTIAVSMNFLSGPLCLIFGLLLIKEVLDFFVSKKDDKSDDSKGIGFVIGRATLLLWLCSGMGAFLVFVDNKTDLGVMAVTILALLSGFIFIRYIADHKTNSIDKESIKYLIVSGILFSLACMSKPTAFIDVAVFGVLLCALWLNSFVGLGVGIMGLGFMGILKPLSAAQFMTESLGKWLILIGLLITIFGILMMFIKRDDEGKRYKSLFSYLFVWAVTLVSSLVVFKGPWLAYKQINFTHDFSIGNWGKNLIMSFNNSGREIKNEMGNRILFAATEEYLDLEAQNEIDKEYLDSLENLATLTESASNITPEQCLNLKYSDDELNEGLQEAPIGNEDFGRYVGYGWKELSGGYVVPLEIFNKSYKLKGKFLFYKMLRLFYPNDGKCYGINSDAKILCKNQSAINNGDINAIKNLKLKEGSPAFEILQSGLEAYNENPDSLMDLVSNLKSYYQDHIVYTKSGMIYIPYRYVVPLNIVFNRSLQNLSSYYTDIGFIWLFVFVFLLFSFIYSIIKKDKKLFAVSMATVVGWAIWRVIGSAILWYGVGLLMWTSLVMAMYIQDLLHNKGKGSNVFGVIALGLFGFIILIQFFYNFIRISSQGSSRPFLWYKQSVGQEQVFDDNLSYKTVSKIGYSQKDVFDLQFPQYNRFIEYVKERNDNDGVLIAGTYLQYFLHNQKNLNLDGSLTWFWEQGSDGDVCKMYQRLRKGNIKYLVIDPNVASIVMGEGNKSLFYRFFAKTNDSGKIIDKGALMMLSELIDQGYAKLLYSNNLGATYGFSLSDDYLKAVFGDMDKEELIYLRAQMSALRYMGNWSQLYNGVKSLFASRVLDGSAIQDIADVYGQDIDFGKVYNSINVYLTNPNSFSQMVATLSQDERIVLNQFLNFYILYNRDPSQFEEFVDSILDASLGGGSQLIVVELL